MPLTEQQKHELATSSVSAWYGASWCGDTAKRLTPRDAAFLSFVEIDVILSSDDNLDGQPWASVAGSMEATA